MTAVEWLEEQQKELVIQIKNGEFQIEDFEYYNAIYIEQAKEMEKQEKLKTQIAENESVLEMLRLHGNDSSIIRVFSRLESLKEQLKEINL